MAIAGIGAVEVAKPVPLMIWNASASVPIGLYRVHRGEEFSRGDLVLAWLPESARRFADERGYLPADVPLVKRVAGVGGDVVCVADGTVWIAGRAVAVVQTADRLGRPMSVWNGCRELAGDELFLLIEGISASFDSRYFGPVKRADVIGKLAPLWTW